MVIVYSCTYLNSSSPLLFLLFSTSADNRHEAGPSRFASFFFSFLCFLFRPSNRRRRPSSGLSVSVFVTYLSGKFPTFKLASLACALLWDIAFVGTCPGMGNTDPKLNCCPKTSWPPQIPSGDPRLQLYLPTRGCYSNAQAPTKYWHTSIWAKSSVSDGCCGIALEYCANHWQPYAS